MDAGSAILSFSPGSDPGRGNPGAQSGWETGGAARPVLLALDLDDAMVRAVDGLSDWQVVAIRSHDLTAKTLVRWRPASIAMPLWSLRADALQLLQQVVALGYLGPVEVLAPPLPDREMVLRELSLAAPGLRLRLTELP